jgi:hypothetical protein
MNWPLGWSSAEVREAWAQSFTDVLGWAILAALLFLFPILVLYSRGRRRRRFWCALTQREVEVRFEEHGIPGFRRAVAVRSCSVFDPPTAVSCHRRCLDADFRRQWPSALPVGRLD